MKVMIAAGGTGGHIYPATALAEVLKQKQPESEILFFGSNDRMESTVIPQLGYKFYGLDMKSGNGGFLNKAKSMISLLSAYKQAREILKQERPDICIGFGNYISVPLIMAAHKMGIKTMIHEQNSYAGKANKFLSKYVDAIVSCYEANLSQMPKEKQRLLGNPQATLAANTTFDPSCLSDIGLDAAKPFVVCMMGSLGSASVSKVLDEACPLFEDDFQVVIASGKSNDYTFTFESSDHVKIVDYVDGKTMLKGCSLAVLRAGATTMCEIGAIGCASILIPSPYVPNNHQFYNAEELVKKGAALMIEEKNLTAAKLADTVNFLMHNEKKRDALKKNAYMQGKRNAADQMIAWMEEIVNA